MSRPVKVKILQTVKDFQQYAKKYGYRGYSRLKKDELKKLVSKPPPDYEAIKKKKDEERRQRGEYTLGELKRKAKENGLRGYSKLNKLQLQELLANPIALENMTVNRLRSIARERGLTGYSRLNRNALIQRLNPDKPVSYTVELEVTLQEINRDWSELKRVTISLTRAAAERYETHLQNPTDTTNVVAHDLFEKLDMLEWVENRESLSPLVRIVSITRGNAASSDFDHNNVEVTNAFAPQVFSHWTDSTEWDSSEFRPNRCMATVFLRKFKPILNRRRLKPNPILTYEGLWKLARPDDPVPDENSDWPLLRTDANVWLEKFRIPGLMIDIKCSMQVRSASGKPEH